MPRMSKTKYTLIIAAIAFVVFAIVVTSRWLTIVNSPLAIHKTPTEFIIKPGTHTTQLAANLVGQGIITHPNYFIWMLRLQGHTRSIKAGLYQIEANLTMRQLAEKFSYGKVIQPRITLIEGWTVKNVLQELQKHSLVKHKLINATNKEIVERLKIPFNNPEGLLLPDTVAVGMAKARQEPTL